MTRTTGMLAGGAGLVIVATVLLALMLPRPPIGIALTALALAAIGVVLLLAGVIIAASIKAMLISGAALQVVGTAIFIGAQPRAEPAVMVVALLLGAAGFWFLLTGVVAAGVKIGTREAAAARDDPEATSA